MIASMNTITGYVRELLSWRLDSTSRSISVESSSSASSRWASAMKRSALADWTRMRSGLKSGA